jgi:hypothetical protein
MNAVRGFFSGVFGFLLFDVLVFLDLIISLNMTVLNADFVTAELKKLDVYSTVMEQARTMLPGQQYIDAETMDELAQELKPWFEEQADKIINGVYAYLKEDRELNVVVTLEQVRALAKEKVREAATSSLPAELQVASQSQIDAYMSQIYAGIDGVIPASFVLNEAAAGSQVMAQLEQVKQIIGYINTAYKILIAAAILLVLLIALVYWWQPKPITRSIGITFILVGVACILGPLLDYLIVQLLNQIMGSSGAMSNFQSKLPQLAADITAPLRTYGIGFLISGIALTVISFLFRSQQVSPDTLRS